MVCVRKKNWNKNRTIKCLLSVFVSFAELHICLYCVQCQWKVMNGKQRKTQQQKGSRRTTAYMLHSELAGWGFLSVISINQKSKKDFFIPFSYICSLVAMSHIQILRMFSYLLQISVRNVMIQIWLITGQRNTELLSERLEELWQGL